jgi:hypothetical protein
MALTGVTPALVALVVSAVTPGPVVSVGPLVVPVVPVARRVPPVVVGPVLRAAMAHRSCVTASLVVAAVPVVTAPVVVPVVPVAPRTTVPRPG